MIILRAVASEIHCCVMISFNFISNLLRKQNLHVSPQLIPRHLPHKNSISGNINYLSYHQRASHRSGFESYRLNLINKNEKIKQKGRGDKVLGTQYNGMMLISSSILLLSLLSTNDYFNEIKITSQLTLMDGSRKQEEQDDDSQSKEYTHISIDRDEGGRLNEKESKQRSTKKRNSKSPQRFPTYDHIRRANTRISVVDSVIMGYENTLRDVASLEKVFNYFASLVYDGKDLMTPLDLVRAITPGVPPCPTQKPINVPLFEADEKTILLKKREIPPFFKFVEGDNGLVSYGRFLVIITLISIPEHELDTAYHMSCGEDFKDQTLVSSGMTVRNFDFIMTRNIKVRGRGYDASTHSQTSILRRLFGPNLDKTLSLEEFKSFIAQLRREILKLEFLLLSDGGGGIDVESEDPDDRPTMSVAAFAKSVAALVPADYRTEFQKRAEALADEVVPSNVLHGVRPGIDDDRLAYQVLVPFEDFVTWKECLKSLDLMEALTFKYSSPRFSPSNMRRSSKAACGRPLSHAQVWAIFRLFDPEGKNELYHDDFVQLLVPHLASTKPVTDADGLGLDSLFSCMYNSCKRCAGEWYDGTLDE